MLIPSDLGLPSKFLSFRKGQDEAILSLFMSEKRFSLECASTGAGKSLINFSLARMRGGRALYLVATKSLQTQLMPDFSSIGLVDIRGHSNYPCASTSYDDLGEFLDLECTAKQSNRQCLYWDQDVPACLDSDLVVTNYHHWVQLKKSDDPDRLGKFDLLILDEAHAVPDILVDLLSINLSPRIVRQWLNMSLPSAESSIPIWVAWAKEARDVARDKYRELSKQSKDERGRENKELIKIVKLGKDLARLAEIDRHNIPWVCQKTSSGVSLSPVWASPYAEEFLFRGIPRVVLSSATLSPLVGNYLGIPKSNSDYHEVDSHFDSRRRPVIYVPTVRVDYRMTEGHKRILMRNLNSIVADRLDRKGLIHTISYPYAEMISERFEPRELLLTHNKRNLQNVLTKYRSSQEPFVLASPAIREGYDFPGDIARYQIILKVPFVDSRDPLIAARKKEDKQYTNYLAAISVMQMAGRIVRSVDDLGETVFLDDHWGNYFHKSPHFPTYFRKSFVFCQRGTLPKPLMLD